jgi:hypothetical protein
MSAADTLLSCLEGVTRRGAGRWEARCPAHADKHPSLSIRELDDGRILAHCFAGCAVESVLAAVGLTLSDLYPPRALGCHCKPERRPFPAADVLRAISFEALLVATAAAHLSKGKPLSEVDRARLMVAHTRIRAAVEETGHA